MTAPKQHQDPADMMFPVRCTHCGGIYDTGPVEVVARYADCTVYIAPCCNRQVDDRPAGLVSMPAFTRLTREQAVAAGRGGGWLKDGNGMVTWLPCRWPW